MASVLPKLAIVAAVSGLPFMVASFTSSYWTTTALNATQTLNEKHAGLWQECEENNQNVTCRSLKSKSAWWTATVISMCVAFVFNAAAVYMMGQFFFSLQSRTKTIGLVNMGMAAGFTVTAIVVFSTEHKHIPEMDGQLGWSWGLLLAALVMQVLSFILTASTNSQRMKDFKSKGFSGREYKLGSKRLRDKSSSASADKSCEQALILGLQRNHSMGFYGWQDIWISLTESNKK